MAFDPENSGVPAVVANGTVVPAPVNSPLPTPALANLAPPTAPLAAPTTAAGATPPVTIGPGGMTNYQPPTYFNPTSGTIEPLPLKMETKDNRVITTLPNGQVLNDQTIPGIPSAAEAEAVDAFTKTEPAQLQGAQSLLQSVQEARKLYGDGSNYGPHMNFYIGHDGNLASGGWQGFLANEAAPANASTIYSDFQNIGRGANDGGGIAIRNQREFSSRMSSAPNLGAQPAANLDKLNIAQAIGVQKSESIPYVSQRLRQGVPYDQAVTEYNNYLDANPVLKPGANTLSRSAAANPYQIQSWNNPPVVNSDSDMANIPSGSYYKGKDGTVYQKH